MEKKERRQQRSVFVCRQNLLNSLSLVFGESLANIQIQFSKVFNPVADEASRWMSVSGESLLTAPDA